MKLLRLTNRAFHDYRNKVKGNKTISKDQARRKLSRNVLLAKPIPQRNEYDISRGNQMFYYGNLEIVVRGDLIVYIKNRKGTSYTQGWQQDDEKYEELTEKLGIVS